MVELVLAIAYDYDDGVAAMVHDHGRRRTIVRRRELEARVLGKCGFVAFFDRQYVPRDKTVRTSWYLGYIRNNVL